LGHLAGVPGGLNGTYFLNAQTIHDDYATDRLIGGSAGDLFFHGLRDLVNRRRCLVQ
jgi:hypothetical protein